MQVLSAPPTPDRIATTLSGAGAVLILVGKPEGWVGWLVLAGAFYGVCRAAGSRAAPWLISLVAIAYGLDRLWSVLAPGFEFQENHPTLFGAPSFIVPQLVSAALLVSVVAARARIGGGLSTFTIVALAVAIVLESFSKWFEPSSAAGTDFAECVSRAAHGWTTLATRFTSISWLAVGFGAPSLGSSPRPVSLVTGAIGACLLAVTWTTLLDWRTETASLGLALVTAIVGWICVAVAVGRLAGIGGGGAAISAMILVILQILAIGPIAFSLGRASSGHGSFGMGLLPGFLGLGLVMFVPRALPLPLPRYLIGGVHLIGASGATIALLGYVLGPNAKLLWGVETFAGPFGAVGFTLLAAYLAFVAAAPAPSRS